MTFKKVYDIIFRSIEIIDKNVYCIELLSELRMMGFYESYFIFSLEGGIFVKKGIHPEYEETTITCACGNVIHTRSTKKDIKVEICSKCHPFYTGKQKLVDSGGRVDRFKKRFNLD